MTKATTGPDLKLARRVYSLLDEHFDEGMRLYRSGWNDERISKDSGASLEVVVNFRREAYGELAEDPAIQVMRDELELLRMEYNELLDRQKAETSALLAKFDELTLRISKVRPAPLLRAV